MHGHGQPDSAMPTTTAEPLLLLPHKQQRQPLPANRAWGTAVVVVLVLLLLAAAGPLRARGVFGAPPVERVDLTLVAGAVEKGAVCLDGTPPGYHLQRGSGSGSNSWLVHLEGGGWCRTIKNCSDRRMTKFGSSNFMRSLRFAGSGIIGGDEQLNPYFYNWNRVYVRYCDGASFSGDGEGRAEDGSTLHFRGLRIYEAVIDELMEKGLANATQALLTGCSAGSLAEILHCDDFSARFPQEVSVKCFSDAGFFLDEKDISGERSFLDLSSMRLLRSRMLGKSCPRIVLLTRTQPSVSSRLRLLRPIRTPMFILNSGYDSWQIRNIIVPDSSSPDNSWLSCKENILNCNSTQMEVLDGFRNTMLSDMKVIEDNQGWGMFIDSCFTHCQTLSSIAWNSPISPRLGNKTIAEAVGGWHSGRSQGVNDIDCECPRNPTCSSMLPP